jgi:uncharacterized protein (DUF1501 family)
MDTTRRSFLKAAAGAPALMSLAPVVPAFLARAARADAADGRLDTVLVVLQLTGGNDGLNSLVPYDDDAYGRARTTLRLGAKDVLQVADGLGFHPSLKGFERLLKDGRLAVIQGVGYPSPDKNHEAAMRDWHTARPADPHCPTGWVGRAVDVAAARDGGRLPALFVGPIAKPFALNAERSVVPAIRAARDLVLRGASAEREGTEEAGGGREGGNPLADQARRARRDAQEMSRRIDAVLPGRGGARGYPDHSLAADLRTVADLVRADVGIRIFFVELGGGGIGGFDNHAGQKENHAALLDQLGGALAAFAEDLARERCLDRVALVTFSEFGRTLSENGRRGTGHGDAAPMFLMGGRVRAGLVGKAPSLTDLEQDSPRSHTDFRRVYATLLDRWLGIPAAPVLGEGYAPMDLVTA